MIKVIDAIMGSGKSTWAINMIANSPGEKYLIVVPLLTEIKRYQDEIRKINKDCVPWEPRGWENSKLEDFKKLLGMNRNIVITHELFRRIDRTIITTLKEKDYTLILDESLNIFTHEDMYEDDFNHLVESKILCIDEESGQVFWDQLVDKNYSKDYIGKHLDFLNECELGSIYYLSKSEQYKKLNFMWILSPEIFKLFNNCYILTYLWNGNMQKGYFDFHNIEYIHYSLVSNKLIVPFSKETKNREKEIKKELSELITLVEEPNLVSMGNKWRKHYPLSKGWYKNNYNKMKQIKSKLETFFKKYTTGDYKDNMWTTYGEYQSVLEGKRYTGTYKRKIAEEDKIHCFVPCNAKATNNYGNKKVLAYAIDIHMVPIDYNFLLCHGASVNRDLYSLSILLQWIWRSDIRNGNPITLLIMSERQRDLFKYWLNN